MTLTQHQTSYHVRRQRTMQFFIMNKETPPPNQRNPPPRAPNIERQPLLFNRTLRNLCPAAAAAGPSATGRPAPGPGSSSSGSPGCSCPAGCPRSGCSLSERNVSARHAEDHGGVIPFQVTNHPDHFGFSWNFADTQ